MTQSCFKFGYIVLASALALVLAGGCASKLTPIQQAFRDGDLESAIENIEKYSDRHSGNSPHAVIAWIERGSMLRAAERFEESDEAFALVEEWFEVLDSQSEWDAGEELQSLLSTPDRITYSGFNYDRNFVAVYRALNAMAMGDTESPRQHFVRAAQWQELAIERNAIRIQREEERLEAARERVPTFDQIMEDSRLEEATRERFGDLSSFTAYDGYANPYADLLHAVYLMGVSQSAADYDIARNVLRRVRGMVPENPFVAADLDLADRLSNGLTDRPNLTYVFFETGVAPHREQVRIPVPVFLVSQRVQIVPVAVPYLAFNAEYVPTLQVYSSAGVIETQPMADIDRIVAAEFRTQLPTLITRMVAAAAVKVGVQYAANKAVEDQHPLIRLGVMITGAIWSAATNVADLRTWASLPKQVQYTRFDTPPSGTVDLQIGMDRYGIELDPGVFNVIVVRSIRPDVEPVISYFALNTNR